MRYKSNKITFLSIIILLASSFFIYVYNKTDEPKATAINEINLLNMNQPWSIRISLSSFMRHSNTATYDEFMTKESYNYVQDVILFAAIQIEKASTMN